MTNHEVSVNTTEDYMAIERLLYRYAMALDQRDAAAFTDCFSSDATLAKPEVVEQVMNLHRRFEFTVHHVLNPQYTIQDRTATGSHYSRVSFVKNTDGRLAKIDVYARYMEDQLVKREDRWLFLDRQWQPIFSTAEVSVLKGLPQGFWDSPG